MIAHSSRQLESLIAIAASVAGAHRLEDVLDVAASRAREATGAALISISRWEVEHGRLRTLINVGLDDRWPEDEVYPLDEFPAAVALLRSGRPHIAYIDDPGTDAAERRLLHEIEMESSAAVPISYEGTTWGELYASTAQGQPRLTDDDVHYLQAICGQIGLALGRAELFSRLSVLAFEDALTRLANRRAIDDRLAELAARGEPAALLLGDLDGLKAVNDTAGHDAGDAVLRRTAAILLEATADAPAVTAARLGGDEFCVLMPGASLADAEALAEDAAARLRTAAIGVTFSWGAAVTPGTAWRPAELLRAADVAQYQAKRSGGDCVRAAAAPVAGLDVRRGGPRTRDRVLALDALLESTLAWLDGPGRGAPPARRVEGVAELVAEALDASSWSVSEVTADGVSVRTVAHTDRRLGPGVRVVHQREAFGLADYPRTHAVVAEGGAFHVDAVDPDGDPAEAALLRATGRAQLLAAGSAGRLVELFGDSATARMDRATAVLRLLVREATTAGPSAGSAAR